MSYPSMFVTDASSVTSTSWVTDEGVRPQRRGDPSDNPSYDSIPLPLWERPGEGEMRILADSRPFPPHPMFVTDAGVVLPIHPDPALGLRP